MDQMRYTGQRRSAAALVPALVLSLAALPALADRDDAAQLSISAVSTRAEYATGGDVLLRVAVPRGVSLSDVEVRLNGDDVTAAFLADATGDALIGLVSGLRDGENVLTASTRRTKPSRNARLAVRNFPASGPVFDGPHQQPWICETAASGLGAPPASGPCVAATIYEWFYRASNNTFKPLTSLARPFPADLVKTTTIDGQVVDYIVRVESGTIDESIYRIAIIDDPTNPIRNPWSVRRQEARARMERQVELPLRRRLRAGIPIRPQRRQLRAHQRPAQPRLRGRVRHPEHPRQRVRLRRLRRDHDDDQGALRRAVRSAAIHHRLGRFRRIDAAALHRPELSRASRRDHACDLVFGPGLDPARRHRLRPAQQLLRSHDAIRPTGRRRAAPRWTGTRSRPPALPGRPA